MGGFVFRVKAGKGVCTEVKSWEGEFRIVGKDLYWGRLGISVKIFTAGDFSLGERGFVLAGGGN